MVIMGLSGLGKFIVMNIFGCFDVLIIGSYCFCGIVVEVFMCN